jgi:hypothetical protein
MHLTPEELLDLAEGTRSTVVEPHLAKCEACRQQLEELRDVMASLEIDVPEPSPLFWDHLSARVRDAVAADAGRARSWFGFGRWSWGVAAVMSTVVVVVAVSLSLRTPPTGITHQPGAVEEPITDVGSSVPADDPSFILLGDLAGSLDWDSAAEAGIAMNVGAADDVVAELTEAERTELQRLLRAAIGPTGA